MLCVGVLMLAGTANATPEVRSNQFTPGWELKERTHGRSLGVETTTETWYSQAIPLKPGHMIYTEPENTPLQMPTGEYMLTYFIGDVVDGEKNPVPLSKLYDHHWIAISSTHTNALCDGGLGNYVFGIGAESRNNPVDFPDGYGYLVPEGTEWYTNLHLLRTEHLAGDNKFKATKECNECYYAPGPNGVSTKGKQCTPPQNGTFLCCGEDDFDGVGYCPVTEEGLRMPAVDYHLRYTFTYTRDVAALTAADVATMGAPACAAQYPVLRDDVAKVNHQSYEVELPVDIDLLIAVGHLHAGANKITLSVNDELFCTATPVYGTVEDEIGNEKGYVVQMPPCFDGKTGVKSLKQGDRLKIDGYYNVASVDDRLNYADGTHLNVMSYMYLVYVVGHQGGGTHPSGGRGDGDNTDGQDLCTRKCGQDCTCAQSCENHGELTCDVVARMAAPGGCAASCNQCVRDVYSDAFDCEFSGDSDNYDPKKSETPASNHAGLLVVLALGVVAAAAAFAYSMQKTRRGVPQEAEYNALQSAGTGQYKPPVKGADVGSQEYNEL